MTEKKDIYTIYGSIPGAATEESPRLPASGPGQPAGLHMIEDMKVQIERFLQARVIRYPIRSRAEFLSIIPRDQDVPGICTMERRKLSLRDLIYITGEGDYPLHSDHEAAELLAGTCPIHTPNIT
jgi:hypothetical protein